MQNRILTAMRASVFTVHGHGEQDARFDAIQIDGAYPKCWMSPRDLKCAASDVQTLIRTYEVVSNQQVICFPKKHATR